MTRLPKSVATMFLAAAVFAVPAAAQIQPEDLATQQAQANAIIQQQNQSTQLNSLQLQQDMAQDRMREQQLFPQAQPGELPYGAAPVIAPPPPPLPPPPPPPAPK